MGIKEAVRKAVGKATGKIPNWDMSDKGARERQVKDDFEFAKTQKAETSEKFTELDNYYHNKHYTGNQMQALVNKMGWDFIPPVLTDAFIQVESQVDPEVPQFQFKGRDDVTDPSKAKIREEVVKYICYINDLERLNVENERPLNKLGNAFWKVSFDGSIKGPGFIGEIVIGNPDPANLFPDPAAYDIDDCEYFDYVYRIHRRAVRRKWGKIIDTISNDGNHGDTEIYDSGIQRMVDDDTLQVVEHWYRDDEADPSCTIQVGGVEVQFIDKYWAKTRFSGNKMYPFIKYCKYPVSKSFWDKGEIETIKDLVDAADREFMTALLNDYFMANDIVVYESDAMVNKDNMTNLPGAKWEVRSGKSAAVRRLGGVSNNDNLLKMLEMIHEKIQETNGNYVSSIGKEPVRVTTASGIAQLNERADARKVIKKADRLNGFKRLYELIDWTALEFYTQDRMILIRGTKEGEQDQSVRFNSQQVAQQTPDGQPYYPKIDVEITAGEGIKKSKAFTLAATQELAGMQITPLNVGIINSMIDLLDLPNKVEIKEGIMQGLQQQQAQAEAQQVPPGMGGSPAQGTMPDEQMMAEFINSMPPEIVQLMADLPPDQQEQHTMAMMQMSPEELQAHMQQMMGGGASG